MFTASNPTRFPTPANFGYTMEDFGSISLPMGHDGEEPWAPWAPMCRWLFYRPATAPHNYFKQLFAQVTNPPIDSIREELVMSLDDYIGNDGNC